MATNIFNWPVWCGMALCCYYAYEAFRYYRIVNNKQLLVRITEPPMVLPRAGDSGLVRE